MTTLGILV